MVAVVRWAMAVVRLFMAGYNIKIMINSEVSEIKISCNYLLDTVFAAEITILDYILIQVIESLALLLQLSLHLHHLTISRLHHS